MGEIKSGFEPKKDFKTEVVLPFNPEMDIPIEEAAKSYGVSVEIFKSITEKSFSDKIYQRKRGKKEIFCIDKSILNLSNDGKPLVKRLFELGKSEKEILETEKEKSEIIKRNEETFEKVSELEKADYAEKFEELCNLIEATNFNGAVDKLRSINLKWGHDVKDIALLIFPERLNNSEEEIENELEGIVVGVDASLVVENILKKHPNIGKGIENFVIHCFEKDIYKELSDPDDYYSGSFNDEELSIINSLNIKLFTEKESQEKLIMFAKKWVEELFDQEGIPSWSSGEAIELRPDFSHLGLPKELEKELNSIIEEGIKKVNEKFGRE